MSQPPQGVKISVYIFFALAALYIIGLVCVVLALGLGLASNEPIADQVVGLVIGSCFLLIFTAQHNKGFC